MTSVSFMLVQIPSFWTCALQWFWSFAPKPCSRWPPSEMVLTCGRTIYAKLEASCQARYTFCHLQLFNCSIIHPRISGFHLPLLYASHLPHQNLSYGVQSLPDLWSHTRGTEIVATCSCIKSFPASLTLLLSAWALPDAPEASPGSWEVWDGAFTAESIPATAASERSTSQQISKNLLHGSVHLMTQRSACYKQS